MESKKNILFIVNPISGVRAKKNALDLLGTELSGNISFEVKYTERANHATELALEAIEQKYDGVVAVGGDGTVNEVAKALIHTDTSLGVIPFGSGNGFARHMKIPIQARKAIQRISQFNVKTIDTASLNNEAFIVTAGMGFDAHIGWKFADYGKRGFVSYTQIAVNEFFSYKPSSYSLIIDGKTIEKKAFLISFANVGQYGNNAWISPSASETDGKINVCILEPFPPHITPDIILRLFNKTIEASRYYSFHLAEEIKIKTPGKYHLDGEPKETDQEIIIKVVPNSLKVIC